MKKITILLCFAALAMSANAQLLWKISGNGLDKPTYIVGSHHLAPPSMIDSIHGLADAIKSADAVYGEIEKNELTGLQTQQKMMQLAMAPADSTLDVMLDAAHMAKLDSLLEAYTGMPNMAQQLKMLKPLMISTQLSVFLSMKQFPEYAATGGIDVAVMAMGEAQGKPVGGLETVDEQLQLLFGASIADQAADLIDFIDREEESVETTRKLTDAYLRQDIDAIGQLVADTYDESPSLPMDKLIGERNRNWAEKLDALMPQQSMLVVVGAAHLPGDDGVLSLLRQKGYDVQPVK